MNEALIVKRPVVATAGRKTPVTAAAATLSIIGLGVFFWLSTARAAVSERSDHLPALAATTETDTQSTVPPAPPLAKVEVASATPQPYFMPNGNGIPVVSSTPAPVVRTTTFPVRSGYSTPATPPVDPLLERTRAPALVVDFAQNEAPRLPGSGPSVVSDSGVDSPSSSITTQPTPSSTGTTSTAGGISTTSSAANDRTLSDTERFSARVGGEGADVARARRMTGLDRMVPQGAVLGAVMETALNSDQPGFARAMTQRDTYSFDGSTILIPAGSRLIGQYKSGVAQGASRLFVLWTRLIRPDGVSIDLGSPATDDLGRGGLGGKVNRHFLERFGGAILTSVLTGGISAATASLSRGSTVFVGSGGQASNLASLASQSTDIPPTITTRQGATVRVFVARDLDFSRVGPTR